MTSGFGTRLLSLLSRLAASRHSQSPEYSQRGLQPQKPSVLFLSRPRLPTVSLSPHYLVPLFAVSPTTVILPHIPSPAYQPSPPTSIAICSCDNRLLHRCCPSTPVKSISPSSAVSVCQCFVVRGGLTLRVSSTKTLTLRRWPGLGMGLSTHNRLPSLTRTSGCITNSHSSWKLTTRRQLPGLLNVLRWRRARTSHHGNRSWT